MREYDVERCRCGASQFIADEAGAFWQASETAAHDNWDMYFAAGTSAARHGRHCPACGDLLGIDPERGPWREQMVPKSEVKPMRERIAIARAAVPDAQTLDAHFAEAARGGYPRPAYIRDGIAALLDWLSGATTNSRWSRWMVERAAEEADDSAKN